MESLRRFTCMLCLQQDAAELRFDRRSKPYLCCSACGSRTFMSSTACWRGLAIMRPYVAAVAERMESDPAFRMEQLRNVEAYRKALSQAYSAPITQTAPAVAATLPANAEEIAS